jgi:hypothetical protein
MVPVKRTLLLACLLALTPAPGVGAGAPGAAVAGAPPPVTRGAPRVSTRPAASAHDMHISSGNAAVENDLLVVRIRFFKDDLELALAGHTGRRGFVLSPGHEADAAFLAYFKTSFQVTVGGRPLAASVVGSGEDELDREPVWWYVVRFQAPGPLAAFTVRNTLLTEVYEDQRNIVKFVHFPDERQKTYSFGVGEEEFEVRF